jgi:diguanylate cyclase (GGDEF)-like protein
MALFNVLSVLVWIAARIANRAQRAHLAAALLITEVVSHAVLAVWLLGWASGFHYYLIPLVAFILFNDQLSTRIVVTASSLVAFVYLGLRALTGTHAEVSISPAWLHAVEFVNIVVPFTALVLICLYFRLASIEIEAKMKELAMTDALTTLANRRQMIATLELERARYERNGRSFGVIIADIDDFKRINDSLGHECGDRVLVDLAATMRTALRAQDRIARWGGEEFLILLPETDRSGAEIVAEKLRGAIEDSSFTFKGDRWPVTMTFGVATLERPITIDECVRRADEALYQGKAKGKNCVVLA